MRDVSCHLCGTDDYTVVFPKGFAQLHRIVKCNRCGLMYANPQELVDCTRVETDDYARDFDPDAQRHRLYVHKQHVQLPDNERMLRVLNGYHPNRGKLLEVGTFLGVALNRIRADGWDVTGLEPDPSACKYARSKYGLEIINGLLTTASLPERAFDAVVMLHVIEHMPNPNDDLQAIHRALKPGGVLVVETPRFDSLMFKLLKHRERSIQNCNGHILFFTVPTLTRLLEKNQFEIVRVDLVGRTLTMERLLFNVGLISRNDRIKQALNKMSAALRLHKVRFHVNVRDMQRIYCRAK